MSAIFCADDAQLAGATDMRASLSRRWGAEVHTEIKRRWTFTLAEDYHQKYRLQANHDLMTELRDLYPSSDALLASPTAMRLNGYLSRCADRAALEREIELFGLSARSRRILTKSVR